MPYSLKAFPGLATAVLEAVPIAVVVLSPVGAVEYVNPFFAQLTGRRVEEVRGQDWFDTFLPERHRDALRALFQEALAGVDVDGHVNPVVTATRDERFLRWTCRNVDRDGHVVHVVALGQDVTESVASEHARREAEERLRLSSDASLEVQLLGRLDAQGEQRVVAVNDAYIEALHSLGADATVESIFGKTRAELMADLGMQSSPEEDACFRLAETSREPVSYGINQVVGENVIRGEATITPMATRDGPPYMHWTVRNLTTHVLAEQQTGGPVSRLGEAEAVAGLGSWEWRADSSQVWLSEGAAQLFGLDSKRRTWRYEELLAAIHPSDRSRVDESLQRSRREGTTFEVNHRLVTSSGETRHLRQRGRSLPQTNGGMRTIGTALDITDRLRVERRLEREVAAKEVLLHEMGHRVKNNLQLISSLLFLQESHAISKEVVDQLRELRGRVTAMTLVHEKLERSSNVATSVELLGYVRDLARSLCSTHDACRRVSLAVDGESVEVTTDVAVPVGLILTEICSNSLKHAFPAEGRGNLTLRVTATDDRLTITAEDDGAGSAEVPRRFEGAGHVLGASAERGLGLRLIGQLVAQLNGDLRVASDARGTRYVIEMPRPRSDLQADDGAQEMGLDVLEGADRPRSR